MRLWALKPRQQGAIAHGTHAAVLWRLGARHWSKRRGAWHRERVIGRIIERIAQQDVEQSEPLPQPTFDISNEEVSDVESRATEYNQLSIDTNLAVMTDDLTLMRQIIATEQPVTFMLLCRRVNALRQAGRVTPTLQRTLKAYADQFYTDYSGAMWLSEDDCRGYSSYRPNSGRDVTEIPEVEIINAITEALVEQVALNEDNLTLIASKKLGFTRRGANVDAAFAKAIATLKSAGTLEPIGDNLRLKA